MKEQWVVEAEQNAKDLSERIYEQIAEEANYLHIDRKWYFEKVVQYMGAESNATNGDMIKAIFPNAMVLKRNKVVAIGINEITTFDVEWWNAPYNQNIKYGDMPTLESAT